MEQNIECRLKKIILKNLRFKVKDGDIEDGMNIVKTFRIDSLQLARIFIDIEGEFQIKFDDPGEIVKILSTFGSLKEYILRKLS
jgi:acyl carrier protein